MVPCTKAGAACNSVVAHLTGSSTCTKAGITESSATPELVLLASYLLPASISTVRWRSTGSALWLCARGANEQGP
jgi:hypothetical protein